MLLTTPESLEAILISRVVDAHHLLRDVQVVVVDELHAFAGDDRGWHLLPLLERVYRIAGGAQQRIGLSATVGNAEELIDWLAGSASGVRWVVAAEDRLPDPELTIDFIGSLTNAARVVAQLHAGEKRLVFSDSRARVEQLGAELRQLGVETYLSHSSLGVDDRHRAEAAFAEGSNCVIVATSTLQLGLDVGVLDRIVQIDALSENRRILSALLRSDVQTRGDFNPEIFHQKFVLRDYFDNKATTPGNSALLSGSANFTITDTHVNLNHIFVFHNSFACRQYEVEFNQLRGGASADSDTATSPLPTTSQECR